MAGDAKTTRRRQNSSVSNSSRSLPLHTRQQPSRAVQPKSAHVSDPFLQAFLDPEFDATDYFNATLPPLQGASGGLPRSSSSPSPSSGKSAVPLAELSTEAQTLLTQLNAHTTRLTNTLTQLTDDILRSGSRLAYEVELLRGETLSLSETLTDGLRGEVEEFVPGGLDAAAAAAATRLPAAAADGPEASSSHQRRASILNPPAAAADTDATAAAAASAVPAAATTADEAPAAAPNEPPYITQLRTLTLVRSRLDSVIKTFGDAMEFVFPPSELSVGSSFLSVSAPDPGAEAHSTEEKGQQVLRRLRDEVALLLAGEGDPVQGVEGAARRVEELKELARVWRGTAEEKGRARFIEGLAKAVEDRHRELLRELEQDRRRGGGGGGGAEAASGGSRREAGGAGTEAAQPESRGYSGGYGFISQLQKIRSGL